MSASGFIAGRLRIKEGLATGAVALSFFIIILALAISAGFRKEIRAGLSEIHGDISVTSFGDGNTTAMCDNAITVGPELTDAISAVGGVESIRPAIYRTGIIRNGSTIRGVVFKGVEADDSLSLCADIPRSLADELSLKEGDKFSAWFIGEKVKLRRFSVHGIRKEGLEAEEAPMVVCPIYDLQRINEWEEDQVSALEVKLNGSAAGKSREKAFEISAATSLEATATSSRFSRLFDWLDLIDFNVAAILILMTIVAGFNMISGLLIILFRNISTIGLLKTLGMNDSETAKVFLKVSASIAGKGMLIGNAAALAFCLVEGLTHIIPLDPANYFVAWVPVSVNPVAVILTDVIAFGAIMLLTVIPTLFISKVDPSSTVRSE